MNDVANYPALLDPRCPWTPLREATGLPNVKWCEETLCAWIAEPANTWSNLAFLLVAAGLYAMRRRERDPMLRFFAPATFWVGLTSLVYHASVTFLTQVFDFFGMYCFFVLVILLNLVRMRRVAPERFFPVLWGVIVALTAFTVVVAKAGLPVQGIVVVLLLGGLGTEVLATRATPGPVSHKNLGAALGFIGVAAVFSGLDASGRWCTPSNHVIQGHAIWHVLDSVGIFFAYLHYRALLPLRRSDASETQPLAA